MIKVFSRFQALAFTFTLVAAPIAHAADAPENSMSNAMKESASLSEQSSIPALRVPMEKEDLKSAQQEEKPDQQLTKNERKRQHAKLKAQQKAERKALKKKHNDEKKALKEKHRQEKQALKQHHKEQKRSSRSSEMPTEDDNR